MTPHSLHIRFLVHFKKEAQNSSQAGEFFP